MEETVALLQFLCWENGLFSSVVLSELLSHIGYTYSTELKTFLEVLGSVLEIEDSWQLFRLEQALKGIPGEKDGLIDIIHRSKSTQPKRAYLFIKAVTALVGEPNSLEHQIITQVPELQQKWNVAVEWLQRELDRRAPPACATYGYSATTWSPPSNEAANGSFFLERSHSAKTTLERATLLRVDSVEAVNVRSYKQTSPPKTNVLIFELFFIRLGMRMRYQVREKEKRTVGLNDQNDKESLECTEKIGRAEGMLWMRQCPYRIPPASELHMSILIGEPLHWIRERLKVGTVVLDLVLSRV